MQILGMEMLSIKEAVFHEHVFHNNDYIWISFQDEGRSTNVKVLRSKCLLQSQINRSY